MKYQQSPNKYADFQRRIFLVLGWIFIFCGGFAAYLHFSEGKLLLGALCSIQFLGGMLMVLLCRRSRRTSASDD